MSLAPGEQRTLAEIESQLGRSDPQLVAMFARFAVADSPARPVHRRPRRCLPGPGGRGRLIILIAVSVTLLIAGIALAMVTASHAAPPRGEFVHGANVARFMSGH